MILPLTGKSWRPWIAATALVTLMGPPVPATEGELITYLPFSTVAPQDIAYDESDGSYWVTAFLDNLVMHFSPGLAGEIANFESPVPYPTGICYNPHASTLFVAGLLSSRIVEVDRAGQPTGRELTPDLEPVVNPNSAPSPRGMAFDRLGDGGLGSIYLVESMGTVIYEVGLDGRVIRSFVHPDDPDGYPGKGGTAPASDVDLIYEGGKLAGFYVNGGRNRVSSIRKLDASGSYTGITIPIEDSGGTVSGILRQDFEPEPGRKVDAYVCVVESNARFAILEGGEPGFHELLDFTCTSSGHEVRLTWTARQTYDAIEVVRGCEVLETLPGNATEWRKTFAGEGVYELTVLARQGGRSTSPAPCTTVIGPGEVLRHREVGGGFPIDLATGGDLVLVSDAGERHIAIYDQAFGPTPVDTWPVSETFVAADEYLTGIAYSERDEAVYLFNATTSNVAVLDELGVLISTFPALLPNIAESPEAEPDLGFVIGMDFDPRGDGGRGSLWVLESARDWIYELDLAGNVLQDFPHPYLAIEPAPPETPYGAYTSGIAISGQGELLLSGGALRDPGQVHIFRVDPASGLAVPGTAIPTAGLRALAGSGTFSFDLAGSGSNLTVLTLAGKLTHLAEVRGPPFAVPPPTFLAARQPFHEDAAFLSFTNNGPYDAVEVYRDCARLATLPGSAANYLDMPAPAGHHQYAVRGLKGGAASDFARASIRVGPGAVLARTFVWPARSPQQLTRDPADGTLYLSTNWYGDERKVYHYDSQLRFLGVRESTLEPPWQIASLAVRAPPGGGPRELFSIAWTLPVPIGETGSQAFFLYRETTSGEPLGKTPIHPPRPTNGFITFPTGLAWEPKRDTFFFLERNSKTLVEMTPAGNILRTFPHPAPPFQNFVFNLGLTIDPDRQVILLTGSDRLDHKITTAREMTYDGVLTGFQVRLGELPGVVTGIAVAGDDLMAVAGGSLSELFRLKAYAGSPGRFLRGDADASGVLNLTDAIFTLNHLFRGGTAPRCEDAADADDNGILNLTDPVVVLLHLFSSGAPPPAPYPQPGNDPTADGLTCSPG